MTTTDRTPRRTRAQKILDDAQAQPRLREFAEVLIDLVGVEKRYTPYFPERVAARGRNDYNTPRILRMLSGNAEPVEDRLAKMRQESIFDHTGIAPWSAIRFHLVSKSKTSPDYLARLRRAGFDLHSEQRGQTHVVLATKHSQTIYSYGKLTPETVRLLAEGVVAGHFSRVGTHGDKSPRLSAEVMAPRKSSASDMDALLGAVDPALALGRLTADLRLALSTLMADIDGVPSSTSQLTVYRGPAQFDEYLRALCESADDEYLRNARSDAASLRESLQHLKERGLADNLLAEIRAILGD